MRVGQQIKRLRLSLGLSQESFAERIGVERNTISLWERDKQTPSKKHLEDVERAFALPKGYFVVEQPVATVANTFNEKSARPTSAIAQKVAIGVSLIVGLIITCVLIALWGQKTFWSLESYLGTQSAFNAVITACCTIFAIVASVVGLIYCFFKMLYAKKQKDIQ
ncbi:MAG: helix-turn-helix domain-containing protein [Christensenellales bacterium]